LPAVLALAPLPCHPAPRKRFPKNPNIPTSYTSSWRKRRPAICTDPHDPRTSAGQRRRDCSLQPCIRKRYHCPCCFSRTDTKDFLPPAPDVERRATQELGHKLGGSHRQRTITHAMEPKGYEFIFGRPRPARQALVDYSGSHLQLPVVTQRSDRESAGRASQQNSRGIATILAAELLLQRLLHVNCHSCAILRLRTVGEGGLATTLQ